MRDKQEILAILKKHKAGWSSLGVRQIGLFGSYAREEQTQESDIDLLIDFEPGKEKFDNLMAVVDAIELLFSDQKVEIVTKNGLSPHIGPKILNSVVYV